MIHHYTDTVTSPVYQKLVLSACVLILKNDLYVQLTHYKNSPLDFLEIQD